jgi:hypothetical protein
VKFKVIRACGFGFATRRLKDAVPICLLISCLDKDNIFFPSVCPTDHSHIQTVAKNPTKSFKIAVNLKTDVYVHEESGAGPG